MTERCVAESTAVPTGNTYDKYGSTNPVVKRLMAGFERDMQELLDSRGPESIVDVGCGEGVLTEQWAAALPRRRAWSASTSTTRSCAREWERRHASEPRVHDRHGRPASRSPTASSRRRPPWRCWSTCPIPRPCWPRWRASSSRWLLVSVPREPLWRALNMARGAYLRDLGNTPGHLNHWSKRSFARLLARHGEVVELRSPFPWTMALVRVG